MITQSRLKELLHYDPETGVFTRRVRAGRMLPGSVAGTLSLGYIRITLEGKIYMAHCLAWLYMTGEFLVGIDHKDTHKNNNSWTNLRVASKSQNACNTDVRKDNTSGVKGVVFKKSTGRWLARITANSINHHLGYFREKEAAIAARKSAEVKYHGEFTRTQ